MRFFMKSVPLSDLSLFFVCLRRKGDSTFWLDDGYDPLFSRFEVGVRVFVVVLQAEILFCHHCIDEMIVGVVLDPHLATDLDGAIHVDGIDDRESDTGFAHEIAMLLAYFVHAEADRGAIPDEPDGTHLWLALRADSRNMGYCCGLQKIEIVFWKN